MLICRREHSIVYPHPNVIEESTIDDCLADFVHEPHPAAMSKKTINLFYFPCGLSKLTLSCAFLLMVLCHLFL